MRFPCCSVLQENFVKEFEWIISFLNSRVTSQLGTRPLSGRGVFVINGVSWMMFDVVVPIGFWLM